MSKETGRLTASTTAAAGERSRAPAGQEWTAGGVKGSVWGGGIPTPQLKHNAERLEGAESGPHRMLEVDTTLCVSPSSCGTFVRHTGGLGTLCISKHSLDVMLRRNKVTEDVESGSGSLDTKAMMMPRKGLSRLGAVLQMWNYISKYRCGHCTGKSIVMLSNLTTPLLMVLYLNFYREMCNLLISKSVYTCIFCQCLYKLYMLRFHYLNVFNICNR